VCLDGGINVSKTGEAIALNESPKITNLTLVNGQLQVDKGYAPFATAYVGTAQTNLPDILPRWHR
jgi:hypothetical protein